MESRLHKMRSVEKLDYSKLTDEEKYVLDGRRESESRAAEVIAATVKGRVKVLESISVKVRSRQIVVRFLQPMESFVGVDANKYGPFQREDIASLPFENARSIIEGGAAVEIHVQT
jgi:DNA replication factor GINS